MHFWPKNHTLEVKTEGVAIPQVKEARFLGVHVDEDLTWEPTQHISLTRYKLINTSSVYHEIYYQLTAYAQSTTVMSLVTLCEHGVVWGSMISKNWENKLFMLQKMHKAPLQTRSELSTN